MEFGLSRVLENKEQSQLEELVGVDVGVWSLLGSVGVVELLDGVKVLCLVVLS